MMAARKLTRKKISTISTSTMPRSRLASTVSVVEIDQFAAIVKGMDLHIGRQDLAVEFFGFRLNAFEHVLRLLAAQHQDDAFHGIIVFLKAELPQARRMPNGDFADVAHADGHAFVGADDDVANVIGIAAPGRCRARSRTVRLANRIRRRHWQLLADRALRHLRQR